jgi:hypothetical protein
MGNVRTRVIRVIIGATGTISKSFRKYVSDIPGNHDVREVQTTAILGTAHILWGVQEAMTLTTENSHTGHCTYTSESANVKEQNSQRRN